MRSVQSRALHLILPATSANLGPAFDAAALALSLRLTIRARTANIFSLTARGRDADICGNPENHLILTTYKEVLESQYKPIQSIALEIDNDIPIGKGLGSSAAARLAGIAAAVYFGKLRNVGSAYTTLTDVYYIQANPQQSQNTQGGASASPQPNLSLVKLGDELHGPEREMQVASNQIIFWENLRNDSKVVDAINKQGK